MRNEYLSVIADGLIAHERGWHPPKCLIGVFFDYDHETQRERRTAALIKARLQAVRAVQEELRRTLTSQIAATARLDRLLRERRHTVTQGRHTPDVAPDLGSTRSLHYEAQRLIANYYSLPRTEREWADPYPLTKYRELLAAIDRLSDQYPPVVCALIAKQVTDHIIW